MVDGDGLATTILILLVGLVLVQRLAELRLAKRNEQWARSQGAREFGKGHYPLFFLLHGGWLVGWTAETLRHGASLSSVWLLWLVLFGFAGILRYWAIATLGRRWNTRILVIDGALPVCGGPYRFVSHPNYCAVALELLALPLVFGAWITALVATCLNAALLLGVRIPAEERALRAAFRAPPAPHQNSAPHLSR